MIFTPVTKLKDKTERSFFVEQVNVYIRLVEVYCEKQGIEFAADNKCCNIGEFINIGVITDESELIELKKMLGDKYEEFVKAVNFAVEHEKDMNGLLDKLSNSKRREIQRKASENHQLTLVDFFCGAGGLSLGFLQSGFNVKLANDIEDVCIQTYKYNHPELPSEKLIQGDIKQIVDHIEDYIDEDIDIVVGGPPCQGFSEANRQRVIDDPRNKLYRYFVQVVEKICPKFVVMENV